jgi:CheY-like chemotaxis protein
MSEETINALIGIVPQVLLILIIGIVVLAVRRPLFENVLPRVSKVSLIGLQLDLQPREVQEAFKSQDSPDSRPPPSDAALGEVGRRASRNAEVIRGRTVLWVDDHPEWTRAERLVMHGTGIFVEPVRTTDEAADVLERGLAGRTVDVVISDIGVTGGARRDEEILRLASAHGQVPVIFYIGRPRDGVPAGAFGLTTRPEELWHLVMDALERSGVSG